MRLLKLKYKMKITLLRFNVECSSLPFVNLAIPPASRQPNADDDVYSE